MKSEIKYTFVSVVFLALILAIASDFCLPIERRFIPSLTPSPKFNAFCHLKTSGAQAPEVGSNTFEPFFNSGVNVVASGTSLSSTSPSASFEILEG